MKNRIKINFFRLLNLGLYSRIRLFEIIHNHPNKFKREKDQKEINELVLDIKTRIDRISDRIE